MIALCAEPAGKYAPGALLFICGLLYLFRSIYTEVVAALPVNGGTYNLLLNTTTKGKASAAACLTMLSYVATAVISSSSAMRYVQSLVADLNVVWATVGVLALVAVLNLMGITESAGVALAIFCFHMVTLAVLVGSAAVKAITDMPVHPDTGDVMLVYNWVDTEPDGGAISGLYFGFSAALLGISGFESSANYVEQQRPGVFPKTLRNMWMAVTLINPTIALLAQCLMPVKEIADQGESGALLSMMGALSAGRWLEVWVIIDAALVLTGAVVSSFVGFTGLVHRMTMDRCLPQVLLATNKWRGTRHWIIIGFWTLTALMVLFTGGQVDIMAGVYTIAFLSVMALFTVGNMLLKTRRASLPTSVHASWKAVITAFLAVTAGLVGNILSRDSLALQVRTPSRASHTQWRGRGLPLVVPACVVRGSHAVSVPCCLACAGVRAIRRRLRAAGAADAQPGTAVALRGGGDCRLGPQVRPNRGHERPRLLARLPAPFLPLCEVRHSGPGQVEDFRPDRQTAGVLHQR